jgi:hypothetical protein
MSDAGLKTGDAKLGSAANGHFSFGTTVNLPMEPGAAVRIDWHQ